jgi:hypothetical protein
MSRCPTCGTKIGVRRGRKGRLSERQVRAIRGANDKHDVIALRYGVSAAMVSLVKRRRCYDWVMDA